MSRYGLLALGGNLPSKFGTPKETIVQCIKVLSGNSIHIRAISRFYQTPCFPAGAGPDFVNAAVAIHTDLNPRELLVCLHDIEAEFGRERLTRWGTRPLDIDLIALDDLVLPDADVQTRWRQLDLQTQATKAPEELILPHPRLQDRAFVLAPLLDVAPHWRHPLIGLTVAEMFAQLPETERNEPEPL
ncbi:2-amino-4-hydroxy-6-hydroxymethyldihydropteridine diphosphokinase [Shimia sp. R9_1]|uniref:2-amino-4-hydroxy-6- hydroxymethyldihydropteridine diphosphokinase n=1 Tax=Shimia sp. R9_1 TaxID=2821111 RepID=UPI001ADD02DD|nr:2-amino-4-hydroxy-6-hydroxymethyldihydropteridine diphosphokinase [Shimia sp. R9_1]